MLNLVLETEITKIFYILYICNPLNRDSIMSPGKVYATYEQKRVEHRNSLKMLPYMENSTINILW